jgi:hypothetical protein
MASDAAYTSSVVRIALPNFRANASLAKKLGMAGKTATLIFGHLRFRDRI